MPGARLARMAAARPVIAVAIVITIAAVAAGVWYGLLRPANSPNGGDGPIAREADPLPDPREVFPTPFRNVKPGVGYVGDAACAVCHRDIAKRYHAHPMGRSAAWVASASPLERYDAEAKFTKMGFDFRAVKVADRVVHRVS